MRFLKTKIQKAQEALKIRLAKSGSASPDFSIQKDSQAVYLNGLQTDNTSEGIRSYESERESDAGQQKKVNFVEKKKLDAATKNIVVNYAGAIASFAISSLALPYLQSKLESENLPLKTFISFVNREKSKIGGICSFRQRLLVEDSDNAKAASCKRVFQWIAEIFIKYYSVNWIIHGKVSHKETYMKYRHKMLRRIQRPEAFNTI